MDWAPLIQVNFVKMERKELHEMIRNGNMKDGERKFLCKK